MGHLAEDERNCRSPFAPYYPCCISPTLHTPHVKRGRAKKVHVRIRSLRSESWLALTRRLLALRDRNSQKQIAHGCGCRTAARLRKAGLRTESSVRHRFFSSFRPPRRHPNPPCDATQAPLRQAPPRQAQPARAFPDWRADTPQQRCRAPRINTAAVARAGCVDTNPVHDSSARGFQKC